LVDRLTLRERCAAEGDVDSADQLGNGDRFVAVAVAGAGGRRISNHEEESRQKDPRTLGDRPHQPHPVVPSVTDRVPRTVPIESTYGRRPGTSRPDQRRCASSEARRSGVPSLLQRSPLITVLPRESPGLYAAAATLDLGCDARLLHGRGRVA